MNTIKECFTTYGFQPIETPSFENSETLMGKYGEEGDRLIFKILNSGDYFKSLQSSKANTAILAVNYIQAYDKLTMKIENGYEFDAAVNEIIESYFINEEQELTNFVKETFQKLRERLYNYKGLNETGKEIERLDAFTLFFGDYLRKEFFNSKTATPLISEKALRYDLTVPFARYVVQHQNDIVFPFKRYQMQPVWRADRPQKGRFREFYQCDADVVGSKSLWQEVELVQLYDAVFSKLGLRGAVIKMNNRKILSGIAEVIGASDKLIDFTVALDKLDKIGEEKVKEEMRGKGISDTAIEKVQPLFEASGSASDKLNLLKDLLASSETGTQGITEMEFIVSNIDALGLDAASLEIDVTLARGLNYYTGAIFEVAAPEGVQMGSIGGGGRYDDLTGIFGLKDISGVGISFGLDRIYLVLDELNLFPEAVSATTRVLFLNFGEQEASYAMKAVSALRTQGVSSELYPDAAKFKKQMTYADRRAIPFVVLAGETEIEAGTYTLKNMESGAQESFGLNELLEKLQ
ncbi:MAG: histidine--tRNA ligase [Aureisphaera sp.]